MNYLATLSAFMLLAIPVAGAPHAGCSDSFKELFRNPKINAGSPAKLRGFEDYEVRLLGAGETGGPVYWVRPRGGGEPFVVKDYLAIGPQVSINDELGIEMLTQCLNSRTNSFSIRSLRFLERLSDRRVKLEYVPGETIDELAATVDLTTRARLHRLFRRQLEAVKGKFRPGDEFMTSRGLYEVVESTLGPKGSWAELNVVLRARDSATVPQAVRLKLKTDNVVIDSRGQFVIIDPY